MATSSARRLSVTSEPVYELAGDRFRHRHKGPAHLRTLQKVQLRTGFSRLLLFEDICDIISHSWIVDSSIPELGSQMQMRQC